MKVAVITAGRTGSMSLYRACLHVKNFTAGHDSKQGALAVNRARIPESHIEIDTRFAWMLGPLSEYNDGNLYFVFLTRDKEAIAASYNRRWTNRRGIIRTYCEGILQRDKPSADIGIARDLVQTVEANIRTFLATRPHSVICLEKWSEDLERFFRDIGAEVDLEAARSAFAECHNESKTASVFVRLRYATSRAIDSLEAVFKGFK